MLWFIKMEPFPLVGAHEQLVPPEVLLHTEVLLQFPAAMEKKTLLLIVRLPDGFPDDVVKVVPEIMVETNCASRMSPLTAVPYAAIS